MGNIIERLFSVVQCVDTPKIVYMLMSLTIYKELKITLKLILKPEL
ncbi:hypothetical protein ALC57_14191 [Trachymyrmex cornetzi]|uniref:Uncharacterized protein n=1 Tax=Trachymyrmex cornetzi TaxID=471704 RepID=A0A151IYI7_9HYME|nr:hypothetical protein ALC57_14191 [Trachymyrmex cornetzi]